MFYQKVRLAVLVGTVTILPVFAQDVPLVTVEKVQTSTSSVPKKYVGQIVPIHNIALIPRVTGIIQKANFKDGDTVKKGTLLFEIEDTTYVAKVKSCEAQLLQNKATLAYAKNEYMRNKRLHSKDAIALSTYENAYRAYQYALAEVQGAEAALMDAKNNLSYTKIYSPIDGRTGKSTLSPYNLVTPSTGSICSVVSLSPLRVKFALSEPVFTKEFGGMKEIRQNAIVQIQLADGSIYPEKGVIEIVDNQFNTSTNTIRIWARFQNKDLKLIPGGFATVMLTVKNRGNLTKVPPESIMTRNDGTYVYVVDPKMKAHLRKVELGSSTETYQEVTSGLKVGETVVKYGTHKVSDGHSIRVK